MLAVLLLQFSALCFNFTDPGGKEKRAKEKEKKKKKKRKKSSFPAFGLTSSCLTLCPVVLHYKKLF
jgi:uncharacterized protein involved in cysteine biosynthesis